MLRHLAGGGDVADGFQGGDQVDHQHRDEQRPGEVQAEVQRGRYLEQLGLVHAGEVQATEVAGQRVADGQGDDDGATAHPYHRDAVEHHDDAQHHAGQQQVLAVGEGAVGHRREAAAHADQADLDQGQADHQHDDAGHQRGDQPLDERQYARDAHLDEGAGDDHAEDRRHHAFHRRALLDHQRPAGDQRADEVEAGALDDQQSGAERAEALALDEGGDAGDHQRHRHDQIGVARRYAQRLADQQARGNDRHDDRQQVLEGGEQGDGSAGTVVQAIDQVVAGAGVRRALQGTHGGGPGKKSAILLGERGLAQAWLRRMSADNAGGVCALRLERG
ncbi:hypothetical protein ALP65_04614 [Pseudomonas aeruginosa]|uniref:Uncharacterized protein n=1 Tax=Pseudomonas aeruginosa TaxID=287 RepID=A0A3M5EP75_PSEAI|nr:hypothetical protein ALP65_04614 [Pseudomonas aeruginosa]